MPASIGVNLRVTGHCRQGGRKYMEDFFSVAYQQTEDEKDLEYAFFGIYDGHGGAEAAAFAKEHLMETIIKHKNFWSDNDEDVLRAIKDGYIATHYAMWREQSKWPKTSSGLPSTAGTTASVAFIRRGKIYIGHVGDSGIILGYQEPGSSEWRAKPLTRDHKPENPDEMKRIESCGGKVVAKSGVPRVVWNRPKIGHQGPVRRSTPIDEIPFLAVARSLGDLWSYNSQINQFIVSPDPDCSVLPIDTNVHRCLIFGTDGLYNMLSASMAVHIVQQAERHNECAALSDCVNKVWLNPSKLLVERALERWHSTKMRADNTSVVTLMLDPPGPPRAQVLKDRKKNLPESGLKIMTRYDSNTTPESPPSQDSCSRSVQTTEISENAPVDDHAKPNLSLDSPESPPLTKTPEKVEEKRRKTPERATKTPDRKTPEKTCDKSCAETSNSSTNTSISSSDISSNYPLKERNFVPKLRESTSFDPRAEPLRVSDVGKENNTEKIEDNTIQINEISSSNIEESIAEDEASDLSVLNTTTQAERDTRGSLRSSSKKGVKRKNESEEGAHHQRKSMRLSLTQKFLDEYKKPAPCTLAEEKLKKLAEDAEKLKKLTEDSTSPGTNETSRKTEERKANEKSNNTKERHVNKLSITQKILKSKKLNLKKKSLVKSQFTKKKLKVVLESLTRGKLGHSSAKGVKEMKPEKEVKKPIKVKVEKIKEKSKKIEEKVVKFSEKADKKSEKTKLTDKLKNVGKSKKEKKVVVTGRLSNFKRQSIRNASMRPKQPPLTTKGKPLNKNVIVKATVSQPKSDKNSSKNGGNKLKKQVEKKGSVERKIEVVGRDSGKKDAKKKSSRGQKETRSSLLNLKEVKGTGRKSDVRKIDAKEVHKKVIPKGIKNSSSPTKLLQSSSLKKNSLRQRLQDKTKSLRKTVLRKSC